MSAPNSRRKSIRRIPRRSRQSRTALPRYTPSTAACTTRPTGVTPRSTRATMGAPTTTSIGATGQYVARFEILISSGVLIVG